MVFFFVMDSSAPFRADFVSPETLSPAAASGTLGNGMRYVLLPHSRKAGRASLALRLDVGSMDDPEHARGVAHVAEHMMFDSTEEQPGRYAVWERLEQHGTTVNALTSLRHTLLLLEDVNITGTNLEDIMSVVRGQLLALDVREDHLAVEKGVVMGEFVQTNRCAACQRRHTRARWLTLARWPPPCRCAARMRSSGRAPRA